MWNLTDCEVGNAAQIAAVAQAAGLGHVLIKIADGIKPFNGTLISPIAAALRGVGVEVWGWHYVYGSNPAGEARIAISQMIDMRLDGYVLNAEQQYRDLANNKAAAVQFLSALRSGLGQACPIGLSSYRYPRYHPAFPWREMLAGVDFNMPQVYWIHATNAGAQLKASYGEFRAMAPQLPFVPTGAAFKEWGWTSTPAQILDFLRTAQDLGLPAVNFWEWAHTRRNLPLNWRAVAEFPWPVENGTAPEPIDQNGAMKVGALVNMNVRSGPGTNYPVIGSLAEGLIVPVIGVGGSDIWVEIAPGRFVAMRTGGRQYLEQV